LEDSGAVRPLYGSLGVKRLNITHFSSCHLPLILITLNYLSYQHCMRCFIFANQIWIWLKVICVWRH